MNKRDKSMLSLDGCYNIVSLVKEDVEYVLLLAQNKLHMSTHNTSPSSKKRKMQTTAPSTKWLFMWHVMLSGHSHPSVDVDVQV